MTRALLITLIILGVFPIVYVQYRINMNNIQTDTPLNYIIKHQGVIYTCNNYETTDCGVTAYCWYGTITCAKDVVIERIKRE